MSERGRPGVPLVTISSPVSFIKPYFESTLLGVDYPGCLLFWICKLKPVILARRVLPSQCSVPSASTIVSRQIFLGIRTKHTRRVDEICGSKDGLLGESWGKMA